MNILEQIAAKAEKGDTGMSLHYGFLYSCVVGLESKKVFEFGSGYSTHVILNALEKTGGILTSCDVTDFSVNPSITEYTKSSNCLLYTSPSPRDLSTSRMPSSA